VLFSEPKIPQSRRNSARAAWRSRFQCSSASQKFLNHANLPVSAPAILVSVLFSEPKVPQ